ncbi:hypothetical protein BP5796_06624 [Coleophoma crateriformis]|uniref:Uncharacterized protein n=1 Tax=Coleophoma crateriformis TaxID=565419 RepID=A0A3D8RP27_9HELO|nr:hypothetical protein BP5796_06624 [Coleophoma crateriformis]
MDGNTFDPPPVPAEQPEEQAAVRTPKRLQNMFSSATVNSDNGDDGRDMVKPPRPVQPVNPGILEDWILEALAFSSMTERQDEVAEAHQKTFEWIFDGTTDIIADTPTTPGQDLLPWLRDTNDMGGIYWINGKPGSGKSTLLRFLYDHKRMREELRNWSGTKGLTVAGFFFWTSGSLEQRSQAGLFRSLLHQLLEQHRPLIPKAFPQIWQRYLNMSTKNRINCPIIWSFEELMEGLKLTLQGAKDDTKICLFIDGVDEFDGDHGSIIKLFQSLVTENEHVKICLSSRPWPIFERALQSVPNLKLQDLTLGDRQQYVFDKFEKNVQMRQILHDEPQHSARLMSELVDRAEGVFLWVVLVVRSLLKGLEAGDRVQDILDRLQKLPSDLDAFFQHSLFDYQESTAKKTASQILQLIRAREIVSEFTGDYSSSSLTLWDLALAHMAPEESAQVMASAVVQCQKSKISALCGEMKTRIDSDCAGLLAIHVKSAKHARMPTRFINERGQSPVELAHSKVTYLHRTIRDWLVYCPSVWTKVASITAQMDYEPHSNLLASQVLQLKLPFDEPEKHRRLDEWWSGIVLAMTHARYVHTTDETLHKRSLYLVDEFEKTLTWYWLPKISQLDDHWARATFGSYEARNNKIISHPFLALGTKFGLRDYVMCKVIAARGQRDQLGYRGGRPLLSYSTDFLISRRQSVYPLSDPEFVQELLHTNQDPNLVYIDSGKKEETPWLSCIKLVREALRRKWITAASGDVERWTKILRLYVEAGADVDAVILADAWDPEVTVLGVVESVLDAFDFQGLKAVKDLMLLKSVKPRPH